MLNFILGFMLAWLIVSIILFIYDSRIYCPDIVFVCLSLPLQILSIPYFLIKMKRR